MSSTVIQLLNSMSGAEKRYCKLYLKTFSGKTGINKTLKDFIALELISKGSGNTKKKLTEGNTTRLYHKILDALFLFHQSNLVPDEKLFVRRARLLYSKGFYDEAFKMTSKILKQHLHENHLEKIEVIELRILNALNKSNIDYLKTEFNSDKKKLKEISNEFFNLVDYETLWASLKLESTTSYFFGKKSTFRSSLLERETTALSPAAKVLYNKIKGFLSIKNGNYPAANFHANRTKFLYENHPYLIKKDPGDYLRSIRNICISLIFNKMYNETEHLLAELESKPYHFLKSKNVDVVTEYFTLQVLIMLDVIISAGKMRSFGEEVSKLESKFNTVKDILPLNEKINSNISFSLVNIYNENYRKALKQVNYVLKNAINFRNDVYHLGLMSELVVHFYLNNLELLESKINAFKRYINDPDLPFGFEKELPVLLMRILNEPGKKTHYETLHKTMMDSLEKENKMVYKNFIALFYLNPIIKKPRMSEAF